MGEHNRPIDCPWCRNRHPRRFLCDPAAYVLTEAGRRGESGTLPTIEFETPMDMALDPRADTLVAQIVVKAGLIPAPGGVIHPALVFTGMDVQRRTLPQWIHAASDTELRHTARLVHDMAELAIGQADAQNTGSRS